MSNRELNEELKRTTPQRAINNRKKKKKKMICVTINNIQIYFHSSAVYWLFPGFFFLFVFTFDDIWKMYVDFFFFSTLMNRNKYKRFSLIQKFEIEVSKFKSKTKDNSKKIYRKLKLKRNVFHQNNLQQSEKKKTLLKHTDCNFLYKILGEIWVHKQNINWNIYLLWHSLSRGGVFWTYKSSSL